MFLQNLLNYHIKNASQLHKINQEREIKEINLNLITNGNLLMCNMKHELIDMCTIMCVHYICSLHTCFQLLSRIMKFIINANNL
jgi:hypothetical protein